MVPVTLPMEATEPAELSGSGVAVVPADADPATAVKRSDRLLYPSIGTDVDYVLAPTETGVESSWIVRSIDSPQELRLDYRVPEGGRLERIVAPDGQDQVAIKDAAGDMVAIVRPVYAVDAAQRPVPASMTVNGDQVVVRVEHRSDDTLYPVYVDPVTESWQGAEWANCGTGSAGGAWRVTSWGGVPSQSYWGFTCNWNLMGGYGLWLGAPTGNTYPYPGYGSDAWINVGYDAPRANTYISDVTWGGFQRGNMGNGAVAGAGLLRTSPASNQGWQTLALDGTGVAWGPGDFSQRTDDANGNRAVLGLSFNGAPRQSQGAFNGARWVALWIRDGEPPAGPVITDTSEPLTQDANGEVLFPWSSTVPSMSASATDAGLGIWRLRVDKADGTTIWGPYWFTKTGDPKDTPSGETCLGTRSNPCPTSASTAWVGRLPFKNIVEGDNVGTLIAQDAGGRESRGRTVHVPYTDYVDPCASEPARTVCLTDPILAPRGATPSCSLGSLDQDNNRMQLVDNRAVGSTFADGVALLVRDNLTWMAPNSPTSIISLQLYGDTGLGATIDASESVSLWTLRLDDGNYLRYDHRNGVLVFDALGGPVARIAATRRQSGVSVPIAVSGSGSAKTIKFASGVEVSLTAINPDPDDIVPCQSETAPSPRIGVSAAECYTDPNIPVLSGDNVQASTNLKCYGPYPYQIETRLEIKKKKFLFFSSWPKIGYDRKTSVTNSEPLGITARAGASCRSGTHRYRNKFREAAFIQGKWRHAAWGIHPTKPEYTC